MALVIGSANAESGMSQAIYQVMDAQLSPPLQAAVDSAEGPAKTEAQKALDGARAGWKKLSFAIASGVIGHLTANLEISGITVQGNLTTSVVGKTGLADPGNHQHGVSLSGVANNVVFTQNNDGTGRIR
jgi:hypothetical protein